MRSEHFRRMIESGRGGPRAGFDVLAEKNSGIGESGARIGERPGGNGDQSSIVSTSLIEVPVLPAWSWLQCEQVSRLPSG